MGARSSLAPYLVAIVAAAFLVRLLGAPWPHFTPTFPDSQSFLKVARKGPFHPSFYFDERPIGFPVLAWIVGRSSTLIVVTQTLLYVGAFYALGRVLTRELSSRIVGVVAVIFVVAVAIESRNALWNTLILSESLSNTCAVLSLAAWLRASARPSSSSIRWAWLATLAWVLTRDGNVIPAMIVIVPGALAIGLIVRGRARAIARALIVGALGTTLACGYVYVSQASKHRDVYEIYDNVGSRILPDPELTRWFVAGGMPMNAALQARTGHVTWDDNSAFLVDPQLARFRTWASGPGSRLFALSLVARAPDWWRRLHAALPHLLAYQDAAYDNFHVSDRLPRTMPAPFGEPRTNGGLAAGLTLAAGGIAITALDRRRRGVALLVAALLLSALVDVYVSYAGDAIEVERHMVGSLLRLSLIVIVAVAVGVDTAVRLGRERRAATPDPILSTDADA